jgi:polyhydroxyalkanoate synthesis regulator phasin
MSEFFEKIYLTGLGTISITKEKAERIVNELISRGKLEKSKKKETIDGLMKKGKDIKKTLEKMMETKAKRILERMDLATKSDVKLLKKRIEVLEKKLSKKK